MDIASYEERSDPGSLRMERTEKDHTFVRRQRARTEDNGHYSDWRRLNERDWETELELNVNNKIWNLIYVLVIITPKETSSFRAAAAAAIGLKSHPFFLNYGKMIRGKQVTSHKYFTRCDLKKYVIKEIQFVDWLFFNSWRTIKIWFCNIPESIYNILQFGCITFTKIQNSFGPKICLTFYWVIKCTISFLKIPPLEYYTTYIYMKIKCEPVKWKWRERGQITRARRGRRREHPQPSVLLRGKPSVPVDNFRLKEADIAQLPVGHAHTTPFGSHGICITTRVRKKRGKRLRNFRLRMRTQSLPDRASSGHVTGHVTNVTSGEKAIQLRILRNFRLRMRRTYFRTGPLSVTSLPVTWLTSFPVTWLTSLPVAPQPQLHHRKCL